MDPLSLTFLFSVFLAGVLTFLAPCTLPLLPAYLGFMSGVAEREMRVGITRKARVHIFMNALAFVLGFTVVFSSLGMLAGFAGGVIADIQHILSVVGGVLVILFGLFLIGTVRFSVFMREHRISLPRFIRPGVPSSSFVLGCIFAFGWTPCIGPIVATVLLYAGSAETVLAGGVLLLVYSIGFAIPFLLLALLISQATTIVTRITPVLRIVSIVGGVVLVVLGLHMLFGDSLLTNWFFALMELFNAESLLLPYL